METKYTKGDWKLDFSNFSYGKKKGNFASWININDENNNTIVEVKGFHYNINDNECMANAKLIAAVPDLLEALIQAKKIIRTWHGIGMSKENEDHLWSIYNNQAPEMKIINETIKKATE